MQANAVILAVRNRRAVILESGGIYEEIPNQGYSVGERIEWTHKKNALPVTRLRKGLMIAACLVLLLTSSVLAGAKYLPWTYVSVALGETSVRYCLNARNEVLSAQADTGDGQTILEQVAVSPYEPIEETMTRTLNAMRQDQAEEAPVHVEIASRFGDGKRAEDAVAEAGKAAEMEMTLEQVPWQEKSRPKEQPPEADEDGRPQPADRQENSPSMSNEPLESSNSPESFVTEPASKNEMKPPQETAGETRPRQQDETRPSAFPFHEQPASIAVPARRFPEKNRQDSRDPMSHNAPDGQGMGALSD